MLRVVLSLTVLCGLLLTSCGGGSSSAGPTDDSLSFLSVPNAFGAPADNVFQLPVQATIKDAAGNPVGGREVLFAVTGEGATLVQASVSTNGLGVATALLRSSVAGTKTISAIASPNDMLPVPLTSTTTATFVQPMDGALFVGADGDDASVGTNALQPLGSIAFALTQAQGGDTIYVAAGTYLENPVITIPTSVGDSITLQGDPTGEFTGTAGKVILDAGGGNFGFQLLDANNFALRGFTIINAAPTTTDGGAIWVTGTSNFNFALIENEIYDNTRGITITNSDRFQIEGNRISNNIGGIGDGIAITDSSNGIVARNLIYGNGGLGISVGTGTSVQVVSYNTLYQNAGAQVRAAAGTSMQLSDNIFSEGLTAGIQLDTGSFSVESNNLTFGHGGNDYFSGGGNTLNANSSTADPLLVNPAGVDGLLGGAEGGDDSFALDTSSPAIDNSSTTADAAFFSFGGFLRTMTTRTDGVADGASPDGATGNMGFHERITDFDALSSLAVGDMRATWGLAGELALKQSRQQTGTTGWDAAQDTTAINPDVRWVISKASPKAPVEAFMALTENGSSTNLFARIWDGTRWSEDRFFNPLTSPSTLGDVTKRAFDMEFESLSGDLMVVRAQQNAIPVYRMWSNGKWTTDLPVYSSSPSGGKILWLELAAHANSDSMCVVALDDLGLLTTSVWDGDAWDTDFTLIDAIITTSVTRAFDVVFESQSGDLMLVYGHTTAVEEVRYRTRAAGSTTWIPSLINSMDSVGGVVRMSPSPTSDEICLAVAEGTLDDDFSGAIWTGSVWTDIVELEGATSPNQTDIGVAWTADGTRAVAMFRSNDAADSVNFARYRPGGWNVQDPFIVTGFGGAATYQATTDPIDPKLIHFVVQDLSGDLWEFSSDGDAMQVENGGAPFASGLADNGPNRVFSLVQRQ